MEIIVLKDGKIVEGELFFVKNSTVEPHI